MAKICYSCGGTNSDDAFNCGACLSPLGGGNSTYIPDSNPYSNNGKPKYRNEKQNKKVVEKHSPKKANKVKTIEEKERELSVIIFIVCFVGAAFLENYVISDGEKTNWVAVIGCGIVGGMIGIKFKKIISWIITLGLIGGTAFAIFLLGK
ncbi:MAG: hypothetical protein K9H25_01275 [Rhodospirillum sp.]|nr:hypothetical protein [Rhodospirillum sp.]MCF8488076.1 hypothetical protein [Rhodospirillum sp.]MCF8499872.1 hypothetical protein [Rhodospirillum sp.]